MMVEGKLYVGGNWVEPQGDEVIDVINPATGECIGSVPLGSPSDVDSAVSAARNAFPAWSKSTTDVRIDFLEKLSNAIK